MNGPGMVSMNAAGGPVGGGPVINQTAARQQMDKEDQKRLNTYIYDYLLKNDQFDLARTFYQKFPILIANPQKSSPGKRDVNGVDDMDTDSKDSLKKPQDLPEPNIPSHGDGSCFLFDWWCQFWEIYGARNNRTTGTPTSDYLQHNISQQRARSQLQQQLLQQPSDRRMMGMQGYNNMMMQQNPAMVNEMMAKRAAMNQRNATPQQMQQLQQQQKMMQNQMQRDGSGMGVGGQGPQSPSMGNAPSPSKRPRLDDGNAFNGQPMGPAGRGQPMSGPQMNNLAAAAGPNAPGMLLQNGINPELQQQPMGAFSSAPNMQQKSLEAMNASGIPQPNQMGGQMDGSMDFPMNAQRMGAGAAGQTGGNHALQDYQMQLMLLEQQNKKRLLMARQEQDNVSNHPGQGGQGGAQFPMAPAMSPSGSRAGPSPNPADQMKRGVAGTPKMGGPGVPGSPMPDMGQNRASPVPNFDPNQMPPGMNQQYYAQMGGNMMGRPPSSHPGAFNMNMANMNPQQIEQMRMNGGRMPNGAPWPQGGPQQQMMQQQQGQQQQQQQPGQQQMGTPQPARGNMPPPPAPASQEQPQRTQPSSPAQQGQAPPTPSQPAKANPKGKKEGGAKPAKKNAPKKSAATGGTGATGATPAAENAEPPTPTPSTPITPMHPNSFGKGQNGNAPQPPANQQPPPAQPPAPAPAAPPVAEPSMGIDANASFGMFDEGGDAPFSLEFNMNMDSTDVLDNFDFDALLNQDGFSFGNEGGLEVQ